MKKEQIHTIIRNTGLKVTPKRVSILKVIIASKRPLTIQRLLSLLPEMDQVTTYRTLEFFVQFGVVRQVDFRHGHAHYEFVEKNNDHHHLVCTVCKKVEDFTDCTVTKLMEQIVKKSKSFTSINDHTLELFGVCSSCKE